MNEQDVKLYQSIQNNEQTALEALYDKYEKLLFSFVYKMSHNRELSEEVVQEVFLKIWTKKGMYDASKGKFSSWLLTVTRYTAIDFMRKKSEIHDYSLEERDSLQQSEPSADEELEWKEDSKMIKKAMNHLNQEQQKVITLFYFKAFSQREIAEQLDIPLGTVKGRIRLALQHLKKHIHASEQKGGI
ncbi:RNA polymerase sigma-70 factor [Gracilibacillus boraciitolerans JCM 21714]|uniref:RNA polymerase sigma factor n=1 Tax=Gracilibacillus boraciitolerans JCM 21714 TaxID=1298598 RepID=W4VKF3_9BACI|nr:sigma-70 family RNA polymerase sigma factor [Gracilibacillus boraciitolerans]GAE93692.1 RNA polymerase sigma-70 factor [Gracilibacillus boraciitolerans JCM 21714]